MTWLAAVLLALAAFAVITWAFKAPRSGWEAVAAALVAGLAGYAMQASPSIPAAPKPAMEKVGDDAASLLSGTARSGPKDSNAWLDTANALVAHADGLLTPAALYAYQQAANAEPDNPGPPFFLGLALAQSGRFIEARNLWAELLLRSPADAPWRADLQSRLARLEMLIAQQGEAAR